MPDCSATIENTDIAIQMPTITASRTRACFFDPIRIPYVTTSANGMMRIAHSLDEVREAGAVLERVRGVDVVEPAAVRAELLDRDLAGDRTTGDRLGDLGRDRGVDGGRVGVAVQVLHNAAERQQHGDDERQGQEDAQRGAGQVDPEVAERPLHRA